MAYSLSTRQERTVLLLLAGIQFSHILDFMIMMPLGPQLRIAFDITDAQFGLLVSAYTFAAGASSLAASLIIDRFDRKKLLLMFFLVFALATLGCGLSSSYGMLMGFRTAAGVFGGVLTAMVQTMVGDLIPYERRGKAMGVVMASFSLSTVMGVPLGLYIAAHSSWQSPFLMVGALSLALAVLGHSILPRMDIHLHSATTKSLGSDLRRVATVKNHWVAFAFIFCLTSSGFSIIPYITLYMQSNVGISTAEIPLIYLVGGIATLFTAPLIGRLSDRLGKRRVFTVLAVAALVPMTLIAQLEGFGLSVVLVVTTLFFILVSGRFIPAMAMITATPPPEIRGTFMSLNSTFQSLAMGTAALVSGFVISRSAEGLLEHYWVCSVNSVGFSLLSLWLSRKMTKP